MLGLGSCQPREKTTEKKERKRRRKKETDKEQERKNEERKSILCTYQHIFPRLGVVCVREALSPHDYSRSNAKDIIIDTN